MSFGWALLFTLWCFALTGVFFCLVSVIGKLAREVEQLKYKVYLHEEKIVQLSNELEMCRIYLRDHCMFCMYDMDSDRKEEDAK